nr:MAG TPA: hypothetical protein [Bacteriophage sp.]
MNATVKKVKLVVRYLAKPIIWYINVHARNCEKLFNGATNMPYYL